VTVVARDSDRLRAVVERLQAGGADVLGHAGDVGQDGVAEDALAAHHERFGRLDVLVLNAGFGRPTPLGGARWNVVQGMVDVNLTAAIRLLELGLPSLEDAATQPGSRGAWALFTSSVAGVRPMRDFSVYSATKAALVSLARSVNAELALRGVRACALCPGFVATPLSEWTTDAGPRDRMIDVADLAAAARFVLSLTPPAVVDEIVIQRAGAATYEP
jgi:NAD(P)-dependent dehydrogenase (short-subunit alcohol dehydrogenase family)